MLGWSQAVCWVLDILSSVYTHLHTHWIIASTWALISWHGYSGRTVFAVPLSISTCRLRQNKQASHEKHQAHTDVGLTNCGFSWQFIIVCQTWREQYVVKQYSDAVRNNLTTVVSMFFPCSCVQSMAFRLTACMKCQEPRLHLMESHGPMHVTGFNEVRFE